MHAANRSAPSVRPPVTQEEFRQWALANPGVHPIHHYQGLCACWPLLGSHSPRQKILVIGSEPAPMIQTLQHFAGGRHDLWACRQGGVGTAQPIAGARQMEAEFDIWSSLANRELPNVLRESGFTLVLLLHVLEHVYHPVTLLRALSDAMPGGAILVCLSGNVARLANLQQLVIGGGFAGHVNTLVGRPDPNRPRPRVREYCWRELNGIAHAMGFMLTSHHFYDDPDDAAPENPITHHLKAAAERAIVEPEQLQSEVVMVYQNMRPGAAESPLIKFAPHMVRQGASRLARVLRTWSLK